MVTTMLPVEELTYTPSLVFPRAMHLLRVGVPLPVT